MTKKEIQAERERFERWSAKGDGPWMNLDRHEGRFGKFGSRYKDMLTQAAWIGWIGRAMIDR